MQEKQAEPDLGEQPGKFWPVILALFVSRAVLLCALAFESPFEASGGAGATKLSWKTAGDGHLYLHDDERWLDALARQDATYYLEIAALGYEAPESERYVKEGFFPGYPMAVRGMAWGLSKALGLPLEGKDAARCYLLAATLVSNLALLVALLLLVRVAAPVVGGVVATRAAILLAVFPFSFLLSADLSESLFLLLALSTFTLAARDHFLLAGVMGALAATTRVFGVVLALALVLLALRGARDARRLERLLAVLLVPAGLFLALAGMGRATGDPWIYFKVQRHYGHDDFPSLKGVIDLFDVRTFSAFEPLRNGLQVLVLLLVFAGLFLAVRLAARGRMPWSWLVFAASLFLMPVLAGQIVSLPRYATVLFPVFVALAPKLPGGFQGALLAAASIAVQAVLFLSFAAHQPFIV